MPLPLLTDAPDQIDWDHCTAADRPHLSRDVWIDSRDRTLWDAIPETPVACCPRCRNISDDHAVGGTFLPYVDTSDGDEPRGDVAICPDCGWEGDPDDAGHARA